MNARTHPPTQWFTYPHMRTWTHAHASSHTHTRKNKNLKDQAVQMLCQGLRSNTRYETLALPHLSFTQTHFILLLCAYFSVHNLFTCATQLALALQPSMAQLERQPDRTFGCLSNRITPGRKQYPRCPRVELELYKVYRRRHAHMRIYGHPKKHHTYPYTHQ